MSNKLTAMDKATNLAAFLKDNNFMEFFMTLRSIESAKDKKDYLKSVASKLPSNISKVKTEDNLPSLYATIWQKVEDMNHMFSIKEYVDAGIPLEWNGECIADYVTDLNDLAAQAIRNLREVQGSFVVEEALSRASFEDEYAQREALRDYANKKKRRTQDRPDKMSKLIDLVGKSGLKPLITTWIESNKETDGDFLRGQIEELYDQALKKDTPLATTIHMINARPGISQGWAHDALSRAFQKSIDEIKDYKTGELYVSSRDVGDALIRLSKHTSEGYFPLISALYLQLIPEGEEAVIDMIQLTENDLIHGRNLAAKHALKDLTAIKAAEVISTVNTALEANRKIIAERAASNEVVNKM